MECFKFKKSYLEAIILSIFLEETGFVFGKNLFIGIKDGTINILIESCRGDKFELCCGEADEDNKKAAKEWDKSIEEFETLTEEKQRSIYLDSNTYKQRYELHDKAVELLGN